MAFIHGKSAIVLQNEHNLSSFFNDVSTTRSVETAETTAFGNSAKTYIVGLQDGTISLSGMFDGSANAIDEEMTSIIGTENAGVLTVAVGGSLAIGQRLMTAQGELTSYEVTSPVGDVVAANAEFQVDGGVGNAISLHALAAETASVDSASHDGTASSANGGVAQIHVTANTMDNDSVFKVQHSADNSTFADLATFTTVATTVTTAQRVTVASGTTVNRFLRSSLTASGTGSITFHINFARQ